MKYSEKLGEISDEQFQTALTKYNLGTFIKAEPIPYGNFKQNVFVYTDKGEYVFRGNPHSPDQFEHELFLVTFLHSKTKAPVPWPYIVDETKNIFGWSYILMPKLPGVQLADEKIEKTLTPTDRKELCVMYAENLAEMHNLTWPFCGKYDAKTKTIKAFHQSYGGWVIEQIKNLLYESRKLNNKTTADDAKWVHAVIKDGREALDIPFTPCFVMQDYQPSNTLAEKTGGTWKITGVFDFMEGYFGDGETDLSRMCIKLFDQDKKLVKLFLDVYSARHPFRPEFEKRYPIYIILDRLIVWAFVQKHQKNWIENKFNSFRDWCEKWTKLIDSV